uniref:Kinesin-like protein KIN-12D n=1 Tax=Tanacetum cinerariifolium TaxID=118510 RepID=A0A6L2JIP5_TANCI|nr:kinesin-like protein KIN-12D [Tanacetum cinerariifolium]
MIRDSKFSRRNSGKNLSFDEPENVPVNSNIREQFVSRMSIDSCSRPPLNAIQEPLLNPSKNDQELGSKTLKLLRTPTKPKVMKTPEKQGGLGRNRYGWGADSSNVPSNVNGTPNKACRALGTTGRGSSGFMESGSAHSTPTKSLSVSKPPNPVLVYGGSTRPPVVGGARGSNFAALSKGVPVSYTTYTNVNSVDVPHFDLKEDPSFWMDHSVQVLIRVRPLNDMEISSQGYNRCLKQESAQSLTWVGHPETRFTFDHVACETINQETLFKMVGLPMVENCLSGYNSCMFAYGQTGSGKTHTMLGEINELEVKPSQYRGMTPRIFEFLFARIIAEEESRKDERLVYTCKCSFLEIYNEQIADLLDPSSTNLQLREDVKKGVYVENLTEFEVHTVGDILKLLSQGSANRRVAATNMNRESSRSHSVFTCVIESRWEKDSTSNLRFARLNLVDLAGSERQKSSGAEGERLKEAANINKSLSTLGHVIMVLVDGANARTKHVPYRDSRLTFLLQDSLGGNSKTMIIANVSPSMSSAIETLNTLKFAQRAKLIQNNAVINEDASGDVAALQHQIRLLKEELAILKRHNIARSLRFSSKDENYSDGNSIETSLSKDDDVVGDDQILRLSCKQLKSLETSLNGALRREQSSENCIRKLEEEIEQLNSLVRQREEENRCTKMMLKFREDKISRLESLLDGSTPVDSYLLEENNTLREEISIFRAKVDRNPEVTRFAVENIRLSAQLKIVQDYYEEGEREMLLTEVSELRDQLALLLEENLKQDTIMNPNMEKEAAAVKKENEFLQSELKASHEELQKCRDNLNSCLDKNEKLCRKIVDLTALLETQRSAVNEQDCNTEESKKDTEVVDLQLETEILQIMLKEERSIRVETEEKLSLITKQFEILREELHEAKSVIEALEFQQLASINELENLRNTNKKYDEILQKKEPKIVSVNRTENQDSSLQAKLNKVQDSLDKTKKLNMWYQTDRACHASNEEEMDEVRKQVEAEMTDVIVCLQEEICGFQRQMHESILKEKETKHELTLLQQKCKEKDQNFNSLFEEVEEVLTAGHKALDEANIVGTGKRTWVSDQLQIIARNISEKELRIDELNSCLEDAKSRGNEMESMLRSLRGATLVMSEAHQQDCREKDQEIHRLLSLVSQLEDQIKLYELEVMDAKVNATHQDVESLCYFDKFVEAQLNVKESGFMINNLMADNEAMTMVISHQNEELESLEERLVTELSAKEIELFIMLSKLEDVALEYNDLKKENTRVATVIKKFKEDKIISYVDMHLKDCISLEKDAEIGLLQTRVEMQAEALKMARTLIEENEAMATEDKNLYELELLDARQNAARRAVESSCYLAKFLETQQNINETFFMINKLATENEALKSKEVALINERDMLMGSNSVLEKQLETDTITMKKELEELELMILEIQGTVDEELKQTGSDLVEIKSRFQSSNKLQRTICEEIWSEIIAKDWAMSVLHVCHMGILIDTVTGLNAEKSLLYHDLCESSSLVSQLQEHNGNSRKELEACSMLRGKLLADIKNSYDRVIRKEEEADKLSIKMTSFEKKILDLQRMEEAMLERSSHMGHELSMLLKEVMDDKDEQLRCLSAKEIELIIMTSKLEQVASENNDLQNENIHMSTVLENFKEEIIVSHVDSHFKDFVLMESDANFGLLQNQIKAQEEALINSSDSISALEYQNQMLEISSCKLQHELETKGAELEDAIKHEKEDIVEFETSFEALACELYENIVKGAVLEARLKEKAALISTLEADLFRQHQSTESLSSEIHLLAENAEDALRAKVLAEVQLVETKKAMESLEIEILEFKTALGEKNTLIESLKGDLESVACERNEAISSQSNQQACETRKHYAEEKLRLYEKSVEGLESTLNEYETSQHYAEEKLKLNQKSMEGLECTVNELENEVDMAKGEAESQRLRREELEQELQKIRLQEQSLTTENEAFKVEIANYKMKVTELEDEIKKLPGQQILEQQIHHLEIIREENKALKARNDEISSKLRQAEVIVSRVNEGFANRRAELVRRST